MAPRWDARMRLLHIIPSLDWGSAERQLRMLLSRLPLEQRVIVLRGEVAEGILGAGQIRALDLPRRLDLEGYRRLRHAVQQFAPDVLHAWRRESCRLVASCCWGISARRVASFFDWRPKADWPGQAFDCFASSRMRTRLVPRWMDSSARFPAAQLTSIGYGVTLQQDANRRSIHRSELSSTFGIPTDCPLVGYVGPLLRESRVQDAIWVGDLLKVVRDDVHVLIVGYGPMVGRLSTFRRQVQIEDRVHFVSSPHHVESALQSLDCVWITCQTCVGTSTMLEAMARRIPVIATDLPCHRRFIISGRTGFIVNVGHRAGFARQTIRLLDNRRFARELADSAAESVARQCAARDVVEEYASVYRGTLT
jgi:glycosyltransferase involved in cell wall biosynthesis